MPLRLNEFRLLSLTKVQGEFVGQLSHYSLTNAPKFLALSYTWDDQERDQDLSLLSEPPNATSVLLKVTANVRTALPYIFKEYPEHYIWIDGVCINQDDILEKNIQVPLMSKIYTSATSVVAWLGESTPRLQAAIDGIPQILKGTEGCTGHILADESTLLSLGLPRPSSLIWSGIGDLFRHPWFTRTWTIQEAILPAQMLDVMCGSNLLRWSDVSALATAIRSHYMVTLISNGGSEIDLTANNIYSVGELSDYINFRLAQGTSALPFLRLLCYARRRLTKHPCDKIYGLLGLAHPQLQERLEVDYNKPAAEAYVAFSKLWSTVDPFPELLNHTLSESQMEGLPSWCPNFNAQSTTFSFAYMATEAGYRAGLRESTAGNRCITSAETTNDLSARGSLVDQVAEVVESSWIGVGSLNAESPAREAAQSLAWEAECLQLCRATYHHSGRDVPDAHWRTLIADNPKETKADEKLSDGYELTLGIIAHFASNGRTEIPIPSSVAQSALLEKFAASINRACIDRRYFSTAKGRVGLGPLHTKPGDLICILYNGATPFLLRPRHLDATKQELIGECYVHGIMYGEAFEIETALEEQVFVIN